MKLISIVALRRSTKARTYAFTSEVNRMIQRGQLFEGLARRYEPKAEDGEKLPDENKQVQLVAESLLDNVFGDLGKFWNLSATQEHGNQVARADVVIDGSTILTDVPTGTLMFLEKQLNDVHTLIANMPTLDPAREWTTSPDTGISSAKPVETTRSNKIESTQIVVPATAQHPAQTRDRVQDQIVGTWYTTHQSGALPIARQHELIRRVDKLRDAVKVAREEANLVNVHDEEVADTLVTYILGVNRV